MAAEFYAPVIACSRLRMQSDGQGITTLVCFHGCPLRCGYCINPFSFDPETKRETLTARQLYDRVKQDDLYFRATGGGVTFGGGEPLLYPEFLRRFRGLCGEHWRLSVETSLSVSRDAVLLASEVVDEFIIDCKDADPDIYRAYTGKENKTMLENLELLLRHIPSERILLRLPLIPDFNDEESRERSAARFSKMGITRFDRFSYIIKNKY